MFKDKKDLQKVFGISKGLYAKLEPYILIEKKVEFTQKNNEAEKIPETIAVTKVQAQTKIELNSADSLILTDINGIGPTYTKRILKYRAMLGGFVASEQLLEVYGFTPELYEKIKPIIFIDRSLIKKLNLNKDDFKTINKHPYLSYELTKTIFDWRRKTTITATNLKDILNDNLLYLKLLPYLAFQ